MSCRRATSGTPSSSSGSRARSASRAWAWRFIPRVIRRRGGAGPPPAPPPPPTASREADRRHQAAKLREADFGLTQFFHRAEDYFTLAEEMRARGADAPIVPGVMPITNVRQVRRMAAMSGASVPLGLANRLHAVADRPEEVRRIGVEHATRLCRELLDGGAPGLHFYTMNRAAATMEVCANVGWDAARSVT
jgi:methylenetetrahydrofolate reductase (NADPH)